MGATDKQILGFQAEVKQLLQLMIHSLYLIQWKLCGARKLPKPRLKK